MPARATAAQVRRAVERRCDQSGAARALRIDLIAELRRGLQADWYAWVLTDPATSVGVDPLATVPDLAELPRVIRTKCGLRTSFVPRSGPASRCARDRGATAAR